MSIDDVMNDPSTSYWLRSAIAGALDRDPVKALADAEVLVQILRNRCDEILSAAGVDISEITRGES